MPVSTLIRISVLVALSITILDAGEAVAAVNTNTGAFTTSVPIQVPGHRGLEPSLALSYHSSRGNGLAGVGWSLAGFSTIERQGPDHVSPGYTASDTFRLDGEDLIACGASASPGCLSGGTHFTKHERYNRIVFDDVADEWVITSRNGNVATYTPVFSVGSSTFRYGMTSVQDTLGAANEVTYNWTCDGALDCYPDSVEYNGYRIQLYYWTARVDPMTFATGASLGRTNWLLRSIKVELDNGTAVRAYELVYSQNPSPTTGRSLLESVQMFGKDVVIDANGAITDGTSLPKESYTYVTDPSGHELVGASGNPYGACSIGGLGDARGTGDFNGDGRQDIYCHDVWETGDIKVTLSNGDGFDAAVTWGTFCPGTDELLSTGDFDGDGKTDFMCKGHSGMTSVAFSTGSGLSMPWTPDTYCDPEFDTPLQGLPCRGFRTGVATPAARAGGRRGAFRPKL